jgi:hypothetical protein
MTLKMGTRNSMPSYVSYIFSIRFDLKNLLHTPLTTCCIFICWTEILKILILNYFWAFMGEHLTNNPTNTLTFSDFFPVLNARLNYIFPGKGSVRGRSSLTPRMKQTVGQLLTYEHELRDLSNQVSNKIERTIFHILIC